MAARMRRAGVESRRDLQAALFIQVVIEVEPALRPGARGFRRHGPHIRTDLARLHDAHLRAHSCGPVKADILFKANLGQPQPQIPRAGEWRNSHLSERTGLTWIENGLLQPDHHAAVFPGDFDGGGADAHRGVGSPGKKVHIHGPGNFAAPDGARSGKLQAENGLTHGCSVMSRAGGRGDHGIIHAAALPGVHKRVEQGHPCKADGKLLRGLYFGLRLFFGALLLDVEPLLHGGLGRRGGSQLRLQRADLFGERAIFLLQPVQPLEDFGQVRCGLGLRA